MIASFINKYISISLPLDYTPPKLLDACSELENNPPPWRGQARHCIVCHCLAWQYIVKNFQKIAKNYQELS